MGRELGFAVTVSDLIQHGDREISSTAIRTALTDGRPRDAAAMLGHWHRIEGEVIHGEKRGRELGYPTANMSVAAHIRAEREKARQEVMASCAAWRQGKTPPPLRESPPRASKTTALACIASQLHRPPPEERPGYVPVASVIEESGDCRCSVSAASPAVGRASAATANRLHDSPSSSISSSSSSSSSVELLKGGMSKRGFGLKSPGAPCEDGNYPSDLDEPTDAKVGKYTFHECLIHYMDREKISPSN